MCSDSSTFLHTVWGVGEGPTLLSLMDTFFASYAPGWRRDCGTETIPKVDKIFGPGNQYVMAAKGLVQVCGCAGGGQPLLLFEIILRPHPLGNLKGTTADQHFLNAILGHNK